MTRRRGPPWLRRRNVTGAIGIEAAIAQHLLVLQGLDGIDPQTPEFWARVWGDDGDETTKGRAM